MSVQTMSRDGNLQYGFVGKVVFVGKVIILEILSNLNDSGIHLPRGQQMSLPSSAESCPVFSNSCEEFGRQDQHSLYNGKA